MTDTVFWAAVQGVGTFLAAVAAIIALVIAWRQLRGLTASNELLAASNDAMTESNNALVRPYVVVDYEFKPSVSRNGSTTGTSVFIVIRNDGKTPAHNIGLRTDHPFVPTSTVSTEAWQKSLGDLNALSNGSTVLRSLTNARPLKYYFDGGALFGESDEPLPTWNVGVRYEDGNGREYIDSFVLEAEPWRRSIVVVDPLVHIGKYIDGATHEIKALQNVLKHRKIEVRIDGKKFGRSIP